MDINYSLANFYGKFYIFVSDIFVFDLPDEEKWYSFSVRLLDYQGKLLSIKGKKFLYSCKNFYKAKEDNNFTLEVNDTICFEVDIPQQLKVNET